MLQRRTLGNVVLRTHLRCPWVTHHCSPSRVFFFSSPFFISEWRRWTDSVLYNFENLGSNKVLFYFKYIHAYGESREETAAPAPLHTHRENMLHSERPWSQELHPRPSVKPSVFFHCLSYPLGHVFTNFSSDTDYLFYIFFLFCPDQTVENSVINSTILKVV